MTDNLVPNYIILNPDGTVGANFSGKVNAKGIILPEAVNSILAENEIQWQMSNGAAVCYIGSTDFVGNHIQSVMATNAAEAGRYSTLILEADDVNGGPGTGGGDAVAVAQLSLQSGNESGSIVPVVQVQAGAQGRNILQGDGTSGFAFSGLGRGMVVQSGGGWAGTFGPGTVQLQSVNFTVVKPNAYLEVYTSLTCYTSIAGSNIGSVLGFDGGSANQNVEPFLYFNNINAHTNVSGAVQVGPISAGNHSMQWYAGCSNGNMIFDGNDRGVITIKELP